MKYVYHKVPIGMQGNIIYPLNTLKKAYPKLYQQQLRKYEGRGKVMKQLIPGLNCLWNDVVHLTAVSPNKIKKIFNNYGEAFEWRFYKIPLKDLELNKTIVYLYNDKPRETLSSGNFKKLIESDFQKYSEIPIETVRYYKDMFDQRKKPLVFHRIPHIFYRGVLDISKYKIV